jgi:hypothetical protein
MLYSASQGLAVLLGTNTVVSPGTGHMQATCEHNLPYFLTNSKHINEGRSGSFYAKVSESHFNP